MSKLGLANGCSIRYTIAMQQVVLKGQTYLHAYYVAKEYGYAPAYIRELYDTEVVEGVFYKGTLYLEADSWEAYVAMPTNEANEATNTQFVEATTTAGSTTAEHRYTHHAKERTSRYEKDSHDLYPHPKKAAASAADLNSATTDTVRQSDQKVHATSKQLPVTLAEAEAVVIKTVGSDQTSYTATERPPIAYTGQLEVTEVYAEETAPDVATPVMNASNHAEATHTQPAPEHIHKRESELVTTDEQTTVVRWKQVFGLRTTVMIAAVCVGVSLFSVLFVESYMVVNQDKTESNWRVTWQVAATLLSR